MQNKLYAEIGRTVNRFYKSHPNASYADLLGALEKLRYVVTEEFIKKYPELIWQLSKQK